MKAMKAMKANKWYAASHAIPEPSSAKLARAAYELLVAFSNLLTDATRVAGIPPKDRPGALAKKW